MSPHEYVVHAIELRETLPPVAQLALVVGLVVVGLSWVLAFAWAEEH